MKRILSVIFILVLMVSVCSCGKKNKENTDPSETASVQYTGSLSASDRDVINNVASENAQGEKQKLNGSSNKKGEGASGLNGGPSGIKPSRPTTTKRPIETTKKKPHTTNTPITLQKTGDMKFTASAKNKYITSVADKYKLNKANLVAIYTVPENDSNIVLEFDGTEKDGKPIRTKDTLVAIYTIDKKLNSKRASENLEINEYDYGEMRVIYFTTVRYIMPEFEKELNG